MKRMFGAGQSNQGSSSASSSAGSTFSRASSIFSRLFSRGSAALEDILQTQAECFAAELQEAEEMGLPCEDVECLEQNFEQAAEALVTMKEARSRLQEIRKDCGYDRSGDGKGNGKTGQVASRQASGKRACFDCGMHGQWAGDKECTMPGAGLGRKSASAPKAKAKQLRLASVPLHETLSQSTQRDGQLRAASAQALSEDKLGRWTLHAIELAVGPFGWIRTWPNLHSWLLLIW